ncbi:MAG: hypothetical protein HY851_04745, partial [candidate division Zixibacteria bacterium]|nr:hypothetical protein [candidate division Zixibacteria bacterium]
MDVISNSQQWIDCQKYIARRLKQQTYNTWLRPTRGEPTDNGSFKIAVSNQFVADWIDGHFRELIDEALGEVLGRRFDIVYVISGAGDPEEQTRLNLDNAMMAGGNSSGAVAVGPAQIAVPAVPQNHNLNARYTFETLVVGDFNQFACAA